MINSAKAWADILEKYGRHGDTMLAHITPGEAAHLKQRGGSGTRNPDTGLLEFWGGETSDSPGTAGGGNGDSVSGFGDHGSLGGGNYSESSIGGGDGNDTGGMVGGRTSFSDFANDTSMRAGAPESEISERSGGVNWNEYNMQNYAKTGTFGRLGQEITSPTVKASRWGAPTGQTMGLLGPMAGFLAGPAFGLAMGLGAAMGRAQTPAEQAASMAEMAERGAQNSTGQDRDSNSGLSAYGADVGLNQQPMPAQAPSTVQQMAPARITPESWDEDGFLQRNPEVRAAVGNGSWQSGYDFNRAYQQHAGVPYEAAMTYSQPEKYGEDLLSTQRNEVMPYRGY